MPNLRDIKKRIVSTASTKQITRTMEMVSSAKIRKAFARIEAATPYAEAMQEMLVSLTSGAQIDHPLLTVHETKRHAVFIVVVSDRGLAGGFNTSILHTADRRRRAYEQEGISVSLILCGKKALGYFAYRQVKPVMSYQNLSADPTLQQAREISQYVRDLYVKAECDEVVIFYNHARNVADQDVVTQQLLPVQSEEHVQEGVAAAFDFEPSESAVLSSLLPDYVNAMIYRALLDSAAAEQGARRRAMKSATDNATEIISTLQRSYNRARQAVITTELNEIIGGAAALEE